MTKHYAEIKPANKNVTVAANGKILATSGKALELTEFHFGKTFKPVFYIPRGDVDFSRLVKNEGHSTHCPIKGEASYYSLKTKDGLIENIAWSYEDPVSHVKAVKGHLAFDSKLTKLS